MDAPLSDFIEDLTAQLRTRAVEREQEGSSAGKVYTLVATEIENRYAAYLNEEVPIREAMRLSGMSPNRLYSLRKRGRITFRRGDLLQPRPRRAGVAAGVPDIRSDAGPSIADRRLERQRAG